MLLNLSQVRKLLGIKILQNNEWFSIHFSSHPNVPGALQLEALAQVLTVAITTLPGNKGRVTHAISHTVKLAKNFAGERLDIETSVLSWKRSARY